MAATEVKVAKEVEVAVTVLVVEVDLKADTGMEEAAVEEAKRKQAAKEHQAKLREARIRALAGEDSDEEEDMPEIPQELQKGNNDDD